MKKVMLFLAFLLLFGITVTAGGRDGKEHKKNKKKEVVDEAPMNIVILGKLVNAGDTTEGDTVVKCRRRNRVCLIVEPTNKTTRLKVIDENERVLYEGNATYSIPEVQEAP